MAIPISYLYKKFESLGLKMQVDSVESPVDEFEIGFNYVVVDPGNNDQVVYRSIDYSSIDRMVEQALHHWEEILTSILRSYDRSKHTTVEKEV